MLHDHDRKILAVLDERGAFTSGQVSSAAFPGARSRRQTSGAVRSWLDDLKRRGLVAKADDQKPVCWIRTPAGTVALSENGNGQLRSVGDEGGTVYARDVWSEPVEP